MNTWGLVRLIFLKDVRRYAGLLGIWLGLGLLTALALSGVVGMAVTYAVLPAYGLYLIGFYLTMAIVQIDLPARDLRFLFTRPVRGETVLCAKILFLALFLIVGGWGFRELDYAVLVVPLQPLDHLYLLVESTVWLGAPMAFVGVFALFFRKSDHVLAGLATFFLALFLVTYLGFHFPGVAARIDVPNRAQAWWNGLVMLLGLSGFIVVVLLGALVRYRTRAWGLPLALIIGGVFLLGLVCLAGGRLGQAWWAGNGENRLPPQLKVQIQVPDSPEQPEQAAWNAGVTYHTVVRGVSLQGVEPPYYVEVVGYQAIATLRSGKIIHSVTEQQPLDSGSAISIPLEAAVIGVSAAFPGVSYAKPGFTLRAFTYLSSRLPAGEDLTGATIKGEVQLEIHRAFVAGRISLEPGAVFRQPRCRYTITKASSSPAGVALNLTYVKLPLTLRGDTGSDNLSWALVSPRRNEIIGQGMSGGSSRTSFPVDCGDSHMLYSAPGGHELASDWLTGAELVFLNNETCGEVTLPYQLDNVTLKR